MSQTVVSKACLLLWIFCSIKRGKWVQYGRGVFPAPTPVCMIAFASRVAVTNGQVFSVRGSVSVWGMLPRSVYLLLAVLSLWKVAESWRCRNFLPPSNASRRTAWPQKRRLLLPHFELSTVLLFWRSMGRTVSSKREKRGQKAATCLPPESSSFPRTDTRTLLRCECGPPRFVVVTQAVWQLVSCYSCFTRCVDARGGKNRNQCNTTVRVLALVIQLIATLIPHWIFKILLVYGVFFSLTGVES